MEKINEQSILVHLFSRAIEFGNKWLTLSRYVFTTDENIFRKLEGMMFVSTILCVGFWLGISYLPISIAVAVAILMTQRVIEFVIVYSRNFIFGRGRIFTHFNDPAKRGQWLIAMFTMNIMQMIVVFAYWYRLLSIIYPRAFIHTLDAIDSLYFSIATFITVGGNIYPVSALAKIVTMVQMALTFFTLVIVINGLISIHFRKNK